VFLTGRMAFHAVLEISDPFLQMFFTHLALTVLVTTIAGVACKTGWMTSGTGCATAMI
jgi:hypothetical protein